MGNLFAELKRRHILRAGAAYAVASFGLIEIVSNVAPALRLPDWTLPFIIVFLAVGFPIAMLVLWMRELGPADGATHTTRADWVLIAALVFVIGLVSYSRFMPSPGATTAQSVTANGTPTTGVISIAVLPFVNLSGDATQEFFSDGMTEEITSALAKVQSLRVVGRTSAFEFKGQNKDLRAIGVALSASHLLEGSVRKSGSRVRITAQLIRADDGTHLWTENYDRELTDIFATQDDIAQAIAGALRLPLGLGKGESLVASRAIDPDSHQQYLRALALYRARGTSGKPLTAALGLLEQVVARNPDYAPAWALLAHVYAVAPQEFDANIRRGPAEELRRAVELLYSKAEAAGRRAIELAPGSAAAYAGAANVWLFRGRYIEMEDLYRQALKLDPYNPDALHGLSQQLVVLGRLKEARPMREQLRTLEPLVPTFNFDVGRVLVSSGESEAALAIFKALPVDFGNRASELARTYAAMGRYDEAADALLTAPEGVYRPGEAQAAARLLRLAPATVAPQDLPDLPPQLAFAYLAVGASDRFVKSVLDDMQRTADTRTAGSSGPVMIDAAYAPVRKTDRFKVLARDRGWVDSWRARGWPDVCRPVGADDFVCE